MRIDKPDVEELDEIIEDARKKNPDWVTKYLHATNELLDKDPALYRSYGYYWWGLKRAMLEKGITSCGLSVDEEWAEYTDYGDIEHNVAAAYLYQDRVFDSCFVYSSKHSYYYLDEENSEKNGEECWEEGVYKLRDTVMEEAYEVQSFFTGQSYDDDDE